VQGGGEGEKDFCILAQGKEQGIKKVVKIEEENAPEGKASGA
jgi:hypothetical protein